MSMKTCKLLRQDTTQKTDTACLCPPPAHPDGNTSLKSPASSSKHLSKADKWHHLPFTQAEGQEKLTDLAFFVVCFKALFFFLKTYLAYTEV